MSDKKIAVYAGTFDPFTNGHLDVAQQGSDLFDELIVAIGVNPDKKPFFSVPDRMDMIRESLRSLPNVQVTSFAYRYLVNNAKLAGARYLIRGIRNEADLRVETDICDVGRDINPDIRTVFLRTSPELAKVSSSMVKSLIGPEDWERVVGLYVPRPVFDSMRAILCERELRERWQKWWNEAGATGDAEEFFQIVLTRYKEAHRRYHTMFHILHCLRELDDVAAYTPNILAVTFALFLHDAVYDTHAKDSEDQSLVIALSILQRIGLLEQLGSHVERLIPATKHNGTPSQLDEKTLVDVDLSILGQPAEMFDQYEQQVRQEYEWVDPNQFNSGRLAILLGFLERKKIYSTQTFQHKYERKARENLKRSISRLQS